MKPKPNHPHGRAMNRLAHLTGFSRFRLSARHFNAWTFNAWTWITLTLLLGLLASLTPAATVFAAPAQTAAATTPHLLLLNATNSPILQTLGQRFAARPASLAVTSTDDQAIRQALSSANALGVDLSTLSVDAIKQGHWFQLAHTLDVPMLLENADAAKVAAITGYGQSGQFVLLRPSEAGRRVKMAVLGRENSKASPVAVANQVVTLLNSAAAPQALPPLPGLPVRAQRTWDVEAVLYLGPNQIIFSHQKQFALSMSQFPANSSQSYIDDVNFSIGLYAASDHKWLVVDTAGGAGVTTGALAANTETERGWYMESYNIDMAPQKTALLPPGFTLYNTAPQTPNNVGSYSTSSGFSIGVGTDGILSGQFEQNKTGTVNIPDFAIQNFSVPTGAHWKYMLSGIGVGQPYNTWTDLVQTSNLFQLGKLLALPALASGQTLQPQTEAVWAAPVDFQGVIPFIFSHQMHFRHVFPMSGTFNYQSVTTDGAIFFADPWIDFSQVNYIGDLSVAPQDITFDEQQHLLRAVVHTSQADYQGVHISFFAGSSASGNLIGDTNIDVLATNGRYQALATVPWSPGTSPGTQTVTVKVDQQAGETNPNNNFATQDINVVAPQISTDKTSINVTEGGATDTVNVSLATKPAGAVFITPQPDAHLKVTPAFLTFDQNTWNTPQTFTVSAVDDQIVEGPYTGQLGFLASSSVDAAYQGLKTDPLLANITDNDNVSPTTVQVAEGGFADSYQFSLVRKPTAPVQVGIATDGQTTVTPTSLTFTVDNWNKPQYVVVRAVDDTTAQGTHNSTISHTASSTDPSYNNVALSTVTAVVQDNDGPQPNIDVTTGADVVANDNQCSLREAIAAANANARVNDCNVNIADYHIINLTVAGPYDIALPLDPNAPSDSAPRITSKIVLNARGQTIRNHAASGITSLFMVKAGGNLTINDATLRDGNAFGGGAAWVFAGGTLNLFHSTVTNNNSINPASGGALINQGTLNIFNSAIVNNSALGSTVQNSGDCGAICNEGLLNIANSTISGNRAGGNGGGLFLNFGSVVNLTHVTITGNTADADNNGTGDGGGILMQGGTLMFKNSIIAGNFDTPNNAGPNTTTPDITTKTSDPTFSFVGALVSGGYNVIGNIGTLNFVASNVGDLYGDPNHLTTPRLGATAANTPVNPLLGALAGNPPAYPLQSNSPALDRVPPANCTFLGTSGNPLFAPSDIVRTDQLGAQRPNGMNCDTGAVEVTVARVVASTQSLSVPTGRLGSIYQVVLASQPTGNVTINITTDGKTTVTPSRLVFTPANWNQPQTVTIIAVTGAVQAAQGNAASVIKHTVVSTDTNYNASTIPDIQTTIVQVAPPATKSAPMITPSTLPTGTAGVRYTQILSTTGGTAPYQFTLTSGVLPDGVRLTASGLITGTPATAGAASFVVTVSDAQGITGTQAYNLVIAPAPAAPTPTSPATKSIRPLVECVAPDGKGGLVASFGYRNNNTIPVTITVGTNNFFTPTPQGQGQPIRFLPGRQQRVVNVALTSASVTWTILSPNGQTMTATADKNAKRCKKPITVTLAAAAASASGVGPNIILDWESDADDVGVTYNLLRSTNPNGPWTQVNDAPLVPANGHCPAPDKPGLGGFYYTVENIDPDAETSWFDTEAVTVGGAATGNTVYLPLIRR